MTDKKQMLIDELSKESETVITAAYLYAKSYVNYGTDVTKPWTMVEQQYALENAYHKGYAEGLARVNVHAKWSDSKCSNCDCDAPAYIIDWKWQKDIDAKWCPQCGARMDGD